MQKGAGNKFVTKLSRAKPRLNSFHRLLAFLPAGLGFGLFAFVLRLAFLSPALTPERKVGLLFGAAGLCLVLAVAGTAYWWRQRRQKIRPLPLVSLLLPAYLAPALLLVLPGWIELGLRLPESLFWPALAGSQGLTAGQPWYYLWSILLLAGFAVYKNRPQSAGGVFKPGLALFRHAGWLSWLGVLSGIGLFLACFFVFSIQARLLSIAPVIFPGWQVALAGAAGVLLAPWAIEYFFRGLLLRLWQEKYGSVRAGLLTAALFAALQLRVALFIPAFLFGFLLAWLARRTGRLLPAVLAHAVYNLLALSVDVCLLF